MHKCQTPVAVGNNWLTLMTTRLMKSLIVDTTENYVRPPKKDEEDETGQDFDDREVTSC